MLCGGSTQRRAGQRFISPVNAGARMNPAAMRRAQQSATASIKSQRTTRANPVRTVRSSAPKPIMHGPPKPAGMGMNAVDDVVRSGKKSGLMQMLKGKNKGIAIGAGAAVVAGLAYSGRRGEGSSGGRTGMTRF